MAQNVTLYNLLISCPGDIKEEVTLIESAVDEFNELYAETLGITIKTRHWSKSSYAQSGGKPQALLNEQFVNKCDAAVAIFWTRFGSPTDEYGSGTEEEIEIMLQSGKQVFMYFSDKPIPPSKINGEGSIIITDCKIYDNRTNWKNGGRYLWNDCVKLFDTKLTEPCGSSILSLVQDFNIDYDVTVSGEKFIDIVIDHLDERDFLLDYAKKLEKAYLKVNPKRTQNLIVQEILLRQDIISNIENYLCLVRSAETLVNDSKKSAVDICTNTLAYAMATEKEKELLIKVFQKIEENIQQYSVEKLSRYSNAMSGIGLSSLIEEWIVQNELTEKIYTETELLYVITELYLQICGDFRYQEHIQSICKKWIDGQTPMEINNKETIGIAEVESLCNKRISYEMNFLIGNICDLIEVDGENEEQVDQRNILTLLQKK